MALELGLAVAIAGVFIYWMERLSGSAILHALLHQNRGAVYGALASIFGSLLGFVLAAVAIVLGYSQSERLEVVRNSKHYPTLWKVFTSSLWSLGLATVAALLALVLDRDGSPADWTVYLLSFAAILATFRFLRAIWVLERIIAIVTKIPEDGAAD